MPLRKKPRCSSPDLEAPAHQSSRPNCGVGGHVAQLQRVGERVAAPTRKGPKGNNLQISSSEENPMAPLQLQKGKKKNPDASHERESMEHDSVCEKERWNTEDYREFAQTLMEVILLITMLTMMTIICQWMDMPAYNVLKCQHAKNGQQKAPSPTYLSKGKGKEQARTFKLSGGASAVQAPIWYFLFPVSRLYLLPV
ncbi:hypothetical protein EV424DRAFT_1343245 [Suillus variegatus]|nr:hypothetical protein EV424DRAFT_1343245 [Suillus variegatus]